MELINIVSLRIYSVVALFFVHGDGCSGVIPKEKGRRWTLMVPIRP